MKAASLTVALALSVAARCAPREPPPPPPWQQDLRVYSVSRAPQDAQEQRRVLSTMAACLRADGSRGPCLAVVAGIRAWQARRAHEEAEVLRATAADVSREVQAAADVAPAAASTDEATLGAATADAASVAAAEAAQVGQAALQVARDALTDAEVACDREQAVADLSQRLRLRECQTAAVYTHARLLEDVGDPDAAWDVLTRCQRGCSEPRPPGARCMDARLGASRVAPGLVANWLEECRVAALDPAHADALRRDLERAEEVVEPDAVRLRDGCSRRLRPWVAPRGLALPVRRSRSACLSAAADLPADEWVAQPEFRRRFQADSGTELATVLRDADGGGRVVGWYRGPSGQAAQVAFRLALTGYCQCVEDAVLGPAPTDGAGAGGTASHGSP